LVDRYREETDPEKYHQASWVLVRQPYLDAFQYRFALSQAETAGRLAPQQRSYVSTVGIAQYRVGHYREAVETLTPSHKSHAGIVPADLAVLAMAHYHLGQTEKAKDHLNTLQETIREPQWAKNEEAQAFLREAEALMKVKALNSR
jgi:uncharacterized protein HemY